MVVCRFFLQGNCRFGANCRNEHTYYSQDNRHYRDGGERGDNRRNDNYHWQKGGGGGGGGGGNASDADRLAQAIREEIFAMENGNMWPLTCYAPLSVNGNLRGWEDYSPEETRLEMLNAIHSGTLDNYEKTLAALYNAYREKRRKLKTTSRDTMEEIREYLKSTAEVKSGFASNHTSVFRSSNDFGNSESAKNFSFASAFSNSTQPQPAASNFSFAQAFNQPGSVFGSESNQSGSVFGSQATSIFGGSSNQPGATFGQSQTMQSASVFDKNQAVQPAQNFGSAASPSVFGQSQPIQGFGQNKNNQGTVSVFGQNQPAQNFGQVQNNQATGPFAQNQTSIFGNSAPPNQSIFNNSFLNANPQSNVASSTPFNQNGGFQQGNPGSIFGQNSFQHGGNTFANTPQTSQFGNFVDGTTNQPGFAVNSFPSMPSNPAGPSFAVYSPIDALSQEELSAYQAQTFTFKGIPLNAPPENLCH